ncbi:MAG: HAD family hydrolase [Candidatus Lutacidiplasmatales archaeon]
MAAITFDLWHTLIKLAPAAEDRYLVAQQQLLTDLLEESELLVSSAHPDPVEPREAARLAFAAALERPGRGSPLADLAKVAAKHAGRRANPKRWVESVEALVDEQPFEEVDGAREQLRALVEGGYRTGVVSNLVGETGRSIRKVMERLEMAQFIQSWALSEELPWAKPAPEIFWKSLDPLSTPPSDAVHIGDLGSDVYGARAAGFRASIHFTGAKHYGVRYAALCRTSDPIVPGPEFVLRAWEELPALLELVWAH